MIASAFGVTWETRNMHDMKIMLCDRTVIWPSKLSGDGLMYNRSFEKTSKGIAGIPSHVSGSRSNRSGFRANLLERSKRDLICLLTTLPR